MSTSPLTLSTEPKVVTKTVHVAVGVIRNPAGDILIAKRHANQHQGGLWEFPGGKVEPGETVAKALKRELLEELGIQVQEVSPLLQISHKYSDKSVLLDVWLVERFSGEAEGKEGQPLKWVAPTQLGEFEFPVANRPIVNALRLPHLVAITAEFDNKNDFFTRLNFAIERGAGLIYLRDLGQFKGRLSFVESVLRYCNERRIALVVNDLEFTQHIPGLGMYLRSDDLQKLTRQDIEGLSLVGASCHNLNELEACKKLNLDYAFLSPVFHTQTHPNAKPLGAAEFGRLVRTMGIPLYALGGLQLEDVSWVRRLGAQGIAAIGAFWQKNEL